MPWLIHAPVGDVVPNTPQDLITMLVVIAIIGGLFLYAVLGTLWELWNKHD